MKRHKLSGNYFFAGISVTLVLFMLGLFALIFLQANNLLTYLRENVNIIAELKRDVTPGQKAELESYLRKAPYLKAESLQFISREEAFRQMQEEFGEELEMLDLVNPMYDTYVFHVKSAFLDAKTLSRIRTNLKAHFDFVNDLYYRETLISNAAHNLKKLGWISLGIGILAALIALVLIHNTIRLSLQENRFLIKTMQLVGASWEFISRPYLLKSALAGFISAIIAVAALELLRQRIMHGLPELAEIQDTSKIVLIYGSLFVLGILIYVLSTYAVVKKHLKMRVEDLY